MSTSSNVTSELPPPVIETTDAPNPRNPASNPPNPPAQWHGPGHYPPPGPPHYITQGEWHPMGPNPRLSHSRPPIAFPMGFHGQYELAPGVSSGPVAEPYGPSFHAPPVIDPQLGPHTSDDNNPPHQRNPSSKSAKPTSKVAGSRRKTAPAPAPPTTKAKGKQKASENPKSSKRKAPQADSDEEPAPKRKRGGRPVGVPNYNDEDIDKMLDLVAEHLPLGNTSWTKVTDAFNDWASTSDRPERALKSLEVKFKQLVRTTKPTGNAECPPHVERAYQIEQMIENRAETRVLDDSEHADDVDDEVINVTSSSDSESDNNNKGGDSDTSDDDDAPKLPAKVSKPVKREPVVSKSKPTKATVVKAKVKKEPEAIGPVARRADQVTLPRPRNSRNNTSDLLNNISSALDPQSQAARDGDRATRSMNTIQILTMSQRLQEVQTSNETLRNQIQDLQQKVNEANRRADRAEFENLLHAGRRDDHGASRSRYYSDRWDLNSPSASRRHRQQHHYSPYRSPTRYRPTTPWTPPRHHRHPAATPRASTPDRFYYESDDNREIVPPADVLYTAPIPSPAHSGSDLPEYVLASQ